MPRPKNPCNENISLELSVILQVKAGKPNEDMEPVLSEDNFRIIDVSPWY